MRGVGDFVRLYGQKSVEEVPGASLILPNFEYLTVGLVIYYSI